MVAIYHYFYYLDITPAFYGVGPNSGGPDPASYTDGYPINVPQTAGSLATDIPSDYSEAVTQQLKDMIQKHIVSVHHIQIYRIYMF